MNQLVRIVSILSVITFHQALGQSITQYSQSDLFEVKPVITSNLPNEESETNQTEYDFNKGIKMLQNNQFDDAVSHFNKLTYQYPGNSYPYYFKAYALFNKGEIEESKVMIDKAIELDPLLFDAKYLKGIILLNSDETREAERIMTELIEIPSAAAMGYYGQGLVEFSKKYPNPSRILKLFNKSLETDSTFLEPYIPLTRIYYYRSRKNRAYDLINKALQIDSLWEEALMIRATISVEVEKSSDQFEKDLEKLLKLSPDNYNYISWRGYLLMELGQYEEAVWDIRKSLSIKDTTYSRKYKFSTVLSTDNNLLRVLNHYRENVFELGINSRNYLSRSLCEIIKNNNDLASSYLDSARLVTKNIIIDYLDALIYEKKGDREKAIESYSNILQKDSTSTYTYFLRANLYEKLKEYSLAILDYTNFIKTNKRDGRGYEERGITYFQKELYRSAYYDLSFAISINGNRSDLIFRRAICAYHLKQYNSSNYDLDIVIKRHGYKFRGAFNYKHLNYLALGDSIRALINLDSSAKYNKYDRSLHLKQYDFATKQKNDEMARRALDRLVKYTSNNHKSNYLKRGIWFYENSLYDESIFDLKEYIKTYPGSGLAVFYISECYKALGDSTESSKWLKKAKRLGFEPDE